MGRLVPGSLRVKVSNVPWLQADSTLKPLQMVPDGTGICIENGIKKLQQGVFPGNREGYPRICSAKCLR